MTQRFKSKPARVTGAPPQPAASAGQTDNASKPAVRPPPGWVTVLTCLLLALAVWIVFGQTRHHEFVNHDDQIYVTENRQVMSGLSWQGLGWAFTNLEAGFWHPLTWLSLMTDAQLYGLRAGGYHLSNVGLHGVNTLLLFLWLRRLTGAHGRSAVVAALFAVHPLHVESVAWVAERKDVLSTAFGMLTLLFYARYAQRRSKVEGRGPRAGTSIQALGARLSALDYALALFFFACGLMSKTMVVTLPVVMLLLDYWPLHRLELSTSNYQLSTLKRLVWEKLPFFGLALAAGWLTIHAEKGVGALMGTAAYPIQVRAANAALASVRYLCQTVWPSDLAAYYPFPGSFAPGWVLGALLLLALISLIVLWQGRRHPYLAVGWFWYVITLAPVSGLIQIGDFSRADRFTYVPLVGIFIMASWGLAALGGTWRHHRAGLGSAAALMLTGLLVLAHGQTRYWRDRVSLWTHTLACTSGNSLAHNGLGSALADQGKWSEAIPHFERALQLRPDYTDAYYNLGIALAAQGKWREAMAHYERALQLKPDYADAHNNLGIVLADQGKLDEAIRHYERALQLKPDYADAHNNLGSALASQGKWPAAIPQFERALQLKPDSAGAHNNLGMALGQQGKVDEAVPHFDLALQFKPDYAEAHFNLGNALVEQGKLDEAIRHYERALQLKPDYVQAHNNLGLALAAQGMWQEAIPHYERMLQLKPDFAEAHYNLGHALGAQGKLQEAIPQFERALQLKPDYAEAHYNLGIALAEQGKWPAAIPHYERMLELNPDSAEACHNLGLALAAQGELDAARAYYQRALQLKPDLAEAHYSLGIALATQGKWNEAMPQYERALHLKPAYAEAHYSLGVALGQQKKWQEAIPHYERALQLKPDYAEAHNNSGSALAAQGKWQEAMPHYERALQLKPDYVEAHNNSGIALAAQGKWQAALSHYERALQLKPDYAEAHNNSGIALAAQGKWQEALPHYERALELKPDLAEAHNNSGLALVQQGKWPAAIQHYERALELKPDYADAGCNLAWLLATCSEAQFRNPAEAMRRAQRARELTQSRSLEVLDTLAAAQAAGGDFVRAVETAKQALALATAAGNPIVAREIQRHLQLYQAGQPFYEPPLDGDGGRKKP